MKNVLVSGLKRFSLFIALSLVFLSLPSSGAEIGKQAWPVVSLPQDAVAYSIGEQITVNGIPLGIKGFVTRSGPHAMAKWFRGRLGEPVVETKLGGAVILGKAQRGYFITIQITPAGTGTNGTVTVSHLRAAYESRDKTRAALNRLLARLPSGSKVDTEMVSTDGSKLSRYYVATNRHNEKVNRDRILDLMREDGMRLQYQPSVTAREVMNRIPALLQNGRTLFFQGKKKEAVAVIGSNAEGLTVVQVNVISETGARNE
jgi:hypothetical protein